MMRATPTPITRVLLADDEPLVLGGLSMLLTSEADIRVVAEVTDGESAFEAAATLAPDVVILDVRMPGIGGLEAARRLLSATSERAPPAVLMLTTVRDDEIVRAAVRAGAAGFILKSAAPVELIRAVRAVARGDGWLDPSVARLLMDDFASRRTPNVPTCGAFDTLTARERDVLALISLGRSNREIARGLFIGEGTVKTHVSHLLLKLGLRDRAQAAAAVFNAPQNEGKRLRPY